MEKTADTKTKIRDEFLRLYSKRPLEDIHVTDICSICDISRGTFYYHYPDVIAICEELEDILISEMEAGLNSTMLYSLVSQADPTNLDMFIEEYKKTLQTYAAKQDVYYCLMNGSHGKQFINKWIISVRNKNEINFNYINLRNEEQEWMGTFLAAGLVNMLGRWIDRKCVDDPVIIAKTFAKVLFKGSIIHK